MRAMIATLLGCALLLAACGSVSTGAVPAEPTQAPTRRCHNRRNHRFLPAVPVSRYLPTPLFLFHSRR